MRRHNTQKRHMSDPPTRDMSSPRGGGEGNFVPLQDDGPTWSADHHNVQHWERYVRAAFNLGQFKQMVCNSQNAATSLLTMEVE